MLRRLAALPAREEALEPAAEPGLELVFFPRALPVSETPGNERKIIRMVFDICGEDKDTKLYSNCFETQFVPINLRGCSWFCRSFPLCQSLEWIRSQLSKRENKVVVPTRSSLDQEYC